MKFDQYNQRGWIPGPKESKQAFLDRCSALEHFFAYPPEDVDHFLTDTDWAEAHKKTHVLYDFSPNWIVAHYSNKDLSLFQGAATWISEKENIRIPLVQLKENFETGSHLKMYRRDEVLAHEAVHAARMQFDEPFFEEIFAYQTSPHFWRRFLGPLFQYSWEAYLLMGLLLIPLGVEIARLFGIDYLYLPLLSFLPLIFFGYLFLRLLFLRSCLSLCFRKMKGFLKNPKKKWAVAMRLKDREIFQFALENKKELAEFIKKEDSLRWQLLKETYFKK